MSKARSHRGGRSGGSFFREGCRCFLEFISRIFAKVREKYYRIFAKYGNLEILSTKAKAWSDLFTGRATYIIEN